MNDRELLELAAKAAGIKGLTHDGLEWLAGAGYDGAVIPWNPIDNDGDALRLAVKLGFSVEPGRCWHSPYGPAFGEDVSVGEMTATRRAIVRAAAAIEEAMP